MVLGSMREPKVTPINMKTAEATISNTPLLKQRLEEASIHAEVVNAMDSHLSTYKEELREKIEKALINANKNVEGSAIGKDSLFFSVNEVLTLL